MTFSEKLTELRKTAGETQDALGEVLGVSGKTISKWESAATEPDLTMLTAIADHYKVSADELLGRKKAMDIGEMMGREMFESGSGAGVMQKAYDYTKMIISAAFNSSVDRYDDPQEAVPADPRGTEYHRSNLDHPLGSFVTYYTEDVRMGMQVFRNPAQFRWLYEDREALARVFAVFADPDALAVLYTLERYDFTDDFTSVYLAEHAGVPVENAEEVLEKLLRIQGIREGNSLSKSTVETLDGERVVWNCGGSGAVMGLVCLAKILLSGWGHCNCNSWNDKVKLIGGKNV